MQFLGGKGGYFEKLSQGSKTLDMTSDSLGEMFEGNCADTCADKFPPISMEGQVEGLACAIHTYLLISLEFEFVTATCFQILQISIFHVPLSNISVVPFTSPGSASVLYTTSVSNTSWHQPGPGCVIQHRQLFDNPCQLNKELLSTVRNIS